MRKPFKRPKHFPTENESAFTHGRRRDPSDGVFSTVSARSGPFDERLPRTPVCLRPGAYGPINVSGYETSGASFPGMRTDLAVPSTSVESSALLHASIACAFSQRFCARIYPPRPRTAGSPGPVAAGAAGPHAPADGPQPGGTERPSDCPERPLRGCLQGGGCLPHAGAEPRRWGRGPSATGRPEVAREVLRRP